MRRHPGSEGAGQGGAHAGPRRGAAPGGWRRGARPPGRRDPSRPGRCSTSAQAMDTVQPASSTAATLTENAAAASSIVAGPGSTSGRQAATATAAEYHRRRPWWWCPGAGCTRECGERRGVPSADSLRLHAFDSNRRRSSRQCATSEPVDGGGRRCAGSACSRTWRRSGTPSCARELDAEVADRTRRERAAVGLRERLAAGRAAARSASCWALRRPLEGRVADVGDDWVLLETASGSALVPLAATASWSGSGPAGRRRRARSPVRARLRPAGAEPRPGRRGRPRRVGSRARRDDRRGRPRRPRAQ